MQLIKKLETEFLRTKLILGSLGLLIYFILIQLSGASFFTAIWFFATVLLYIYLPGRTFAFLLGFQKKLPQAFSSIAILLGCGFFAVLYCVCQRLNVLIFLRLLPPMIGVLSIILPLLKKQKIGNFNAFTSPYFITKYFLWGCLSALFAFSISVKNAHPTTVGNILLNQDVLWNIGNAQSFAIAFPPQDIRFSLVRLAYHYLTEMLQGALSIVSGINAYDIIAMYAGPVVLMALLCCLWQLGMVLFNQKSRALLLTFSMFLFNCASGIFALTNGQGKFFNTNFLHIVTNINAQASAVIFFSIFLIIFTYITRNNFYVSWIDILVLLCSFFMLCFSKGPAAAIVVCSFLITMLFILLRNPRPHYLKAIFTFFGVVTIFCIIYFMVFSSGANTSVHFGFETLFSSVFGSILQSCKLLGMWVFIPAFIIICIINVFCMLPVQSFFVACALKKDICNIWKLPAEKLIVYGIFAGGFLAYYLFWHPSYSQLYFVLIAIFAANILFSENAQLPKNKWKKYISVLLGFIGVFTSLILCINFAGSGMRQLLRNYDIIPKYNYNVIVTYDDEQAMQWLKVNSNTSDLCLTNRIHSSSLTDTSLFSANGISNCYSAFSGRQFFMEGYTYAITNMGVSEAVITQKQMAYMDVFGPNSTPEIAKETLTAIGVKYVVFDAKSGGTMENLSAFPIVYQSNSVFIFEV